MRKEHRQLENPAIECVLQYLRTENTTYRADALASESDEGYCSRFDVLKRDTHLVERVIKINIFYTLHVDKDSLYSAMTDAKGDN